MILYVASSRIIPGSLCAGSVACKSVIPSNSDFVQILDVKSLSKPLPQWLNGTPILVNDTTIYKGKHAFDELKRVFRDQSGKGKKDFVKQKKVTWEEDGDDCDEEEGDTIKVNEQNSNSLFEGSMLDSDTKMNTNNPFEPDQDISGSVTDSTSVSEGKITEADLKAYQTMRDVSSQKE